MKKIEGLEKRHVLSELLPYDPFAQVRDKLKILREYLSLLTAGEQAMEALKKGNLKEFDSLVGENACQIRAIKLALIASRSSFDHDSILQTLAEAKKRTESLLHRTAFSNDISLKDFLQEEGLDVEMHYNELFLVESFILSKVKILRPATEELPLAFHEVTDTKKIREFGDVGRVFTNDLVRSLRERVSRNSVSFVQALASELPSVNMEMLSGQFSINYRGLECIPGYWASQILMRQAVKRRIPIVLLADQKAQDRNYEVVQKMVLFFEPTEQGYKETSLSALDPDQPAMVIVGTTCRESHALPDLESWKAELLEYSPIDLILATAAIHRQYPDPSKECLVSHIQDENYQYHKAKACEWGCSARNPSRIFLSHVFCDKIKNVC